jgi:hypothetical protein
MAAESKKTPIEEGYILEFVGEKYDVGRVLGENGIWVCQPFNHIWW